nr:MFS transporter [Parvularcula dongshanensis]
MGPFADNVLRAATIVAVASAAGAAWGTADFSLPLGWSAEAGSFVSMGFTLPIFLFSMISGQVADKVDRHRLLCFVKGAEIPIMIFSAFCFWFGSGLLLLFSLFLMGAQSAFFGPLRNTLVPQYFAGDELPRVNGYFNALQFAAIVAGLLLGSVLTNAPAFGSPQGGRLVVSALLLATAVGGTLMALFTPPAPAPGLSRIDWNVLRVAGRFYRRVADMPRVFWPMMGVGWFWMGGAIILANLPTWVSVSLGGSDLDLGLFMVLFAVGAGVGSVTAGIAASRSGAPMTVAGVGVVLTILGAVLVFLTSAPYDPGAGPVFRMENAALFGAIVLTAAGNSVFGVPVIATLHDRAPAGERARIMGTSNMTNGGLATLGALLVPLARPVGVGPTGTYLAVAGLQVGLLGFMLLRRRQAVRAAKSAAPMPARNG